MSKEAPNRLWPIPTTTGWLHEFDTPYAGADGIEFVRKVDNPDGQLKQLRERQEERRRKCELVIRGTDIPLPPSIPDIDLLLSLYDQLQSQLAQVTQERDELKERLK